MTTLQAVYVAFMRKGENEYVFNLRPCSNLIFYFNGKIYTKICTMLQSLCRNSALIFGASANMII